MLLLNAFVAILIFVITANARFYDVCENDEDCKDISGGGQCVVDDLSIYFNKKWIKKCICPRPYVWSHSRRRCVISNATSCDYGQHFSESSECYRLQGPGEACINLDICYHPNKNLTCHNEVCTEISQVPIREYESSFLPSRGAKCVQDEDCSSYARNAKCLQDLDSRSCGCPYWHTFNLRGDACRPKENLLKLNQRCYTKEGCQIYQSHCQFNETEIETDENGEPFGKCVCNQGTLFDGDDRCERTKPAFECQNEKDCTSYARGARCVKDPVKEINKCLCPRGTTWNLDGDQCAKIRPVYNLNEKCYTKADCYFEQSSCQLNDGKIEKDENNNPAGTCRCRLDTRYSKKLNKCLFIRGLGEFCGDGTLFECYEPNKNLTCLNSKCT